MNKKFTKLLSVFVLAGLIGGGAVGLAGCKKKDKGDEGQQQQQTVQYNGVEVNISDLAASEAYTGALGTDTGITVEGTAAKINNNKKTVHFKGEDIKCTKRLQLNKLDVSTDETTHATTFNGGKGYLKIQPTKNAKLIVYAISGTSGVERGLALYNADGTIKDGTAQSVGDGKNSILIPYVQDLTANTEYLMASSVSADDEGSTVNIYYIALVYEGFNETIEDSTHATAKTETCEEDGHVAYVKTNYGRYFTDSTMTTGVYLGSEILKNKKGHAYTLTKIDTMPTATTTGSATVTCTKDSTHVATVDLPKLDDAAYTGRTQNAAGKYEYVYTDSATGVTITATSDAKVEARQINADTVLIYMDTEKVTHVMVYDLDEHKWVEDAGIVSSAKFDNTAQGKSGASLYQGEADANIASKYDNGTPDTADDFAVPATVKFESATELKLTIAKTISSFTVYYNYKGTETNGGVNFDGTVVQLPRPENYDTSSVDKIKTLSVTTTKELVPDTYTMTRSGKQCGVAFVILKVKPQA